MAVFFLNNSIPVYFFSLSAEPLPVGLGDHPLSKSFNDKQSFGDAIGKRSIDSAQFPSSNSHAQDANPSIQRSTTDYVDICVQIEYLILTILKSSSV